MRRAQRERNYSAALGVASVVLCVKPSTPAAPPAHIMPYAPLVPAVAA
jgi:hypothetical protein